MSEVWRFTGPPENWLTAFGISKWALNEHNKDLWEKGIRPGDIAVFHSTKQSSFSDRAISSIIGLGYVGEGSTVKKDFWWVQEINDQSNHWPYVVPLKEIYLFADVKGIDFSIPVNEKSREQVRADIDRLIAKAIPLQRLNNDALAKDPNCPQFPVNGSASRINRLYEEMVFDRASEFFTPHQDQETNLLEERLIETIDEQLAGMDKALLLAQARAFDNSMAESHYISHGPKKIRKESQRQKRRVAALEDYTCQLCGFKCEYTKRDGKKGWIIQVDHILNKADNNNEALNNLWTLCPNCHAKKTYGLVKIDLPARTVTDGGREVRLHCDHHLVHLVLSWCESCHPKLVSCTQ